MELTLLNFLLIFLFIVFFFLYTSGYIISRFELIFYWTLSSSDVFMISLLSSGVFDDLLLFYELDFFEITILSSNGLVIFGDGCDDEK